MDREKIEGLIRHVLTFGGGYLIAQGWVDEVTVTAIVGALVTLLGTGWSLWSKINKTV